MATDLHGPKPSSTARPGPGSKYEAFVAQQLRRAHHRIRLLDASSAALGLLGLTLAYGLGMALLDRSLELSSLTRQLAFALYAVGALGLVGVGLVWPLLRPINPYFAACQIEHTLDGAKNSVVNWLDLHDQQLPQAIRTAVSHRAAKDLGRADLEQAISARRTAWLGGIAGTFALGMLVLFVLGPRQFPSLLSRAFAPFLSSSIATRTRINVTRPEGGNVTIPVGRAVSLAVWVEGKVPDPQKPDALRLQFRYNPDDPYEERALERGESGREWGLTVPASQVHTGFWYKVAGGDAETPEYRVQVRSTPLLTGFDVTYHYRPYLGWKDETSHDPNLQALRGTEVTLTARTNREVQSGKLILEGQQQIPAELVPQDPSALRFRWVLDKGGSYRVWFTTRDNDQNAEPMPYTVRVLQDRAPQVELTKPAEEAVPLPANGLLQVEGTASDDFGLTGLRLRMREDSTDTELQAKPYRGGQPLRNGDGSFPTSLGYKDFVELEHLKAENGAPFALQPDMRVEYWLEAVDNCDYPEANVGSSKHHWIQITPPEKNQARREEQKAGAQKDQQQHEAQQDQQLQKQQKEPQKEQPKGDQAKPQQGGESQEKQSGKDESGQQGSEEDKLKNQLEEIQKAIQQLEKQKGGQQNDSGQQQSADQKDGQQKPDQQPQDKGNPQKQPSKQDANQGGQGNPSEQPSSKQDPNPGEQQPNSGQPKQQPKPDQGKGTQGSKSEQAKGGQETKPDQKSGEGTKDGQRPENGDQRSQQSPEKQPNQGQQPADGPKNQGKNDGGRQDNQQSRQEKGDRNTGAGQEQGKPNTGQDKDKPGQKPDKGQQPNANPMNGQGHEQGEPKAGQEQSQQGPKPETKQGNDGAKPQSQQGAGEQKPNQGQPQGAEKPQQGAQDKQGQGDSRPQTGADKGASKPEQRPDQGQGNGQKQPNQGQERGEDKSGGKEGGEPKQPNDKSQGKPEQGPRNAAKQDGAAQGEKPDAKPEGGQGQRGSKPDGKANSQDKKPSAGKNDPNAKGRERPTTESKDAVPSNDKPSPDAPAQKTQEKDDGKSPASSSQGKGKSDDLTNPDVDALKKMLQSADAKQRQEAAQKLQQVAQQSPDPGKRDAARDALEQAKQGQGGSGNDGEGGDSGKPKDSQKPDGASANKDGQGGKEPSGDKQKSGAPDRKNGPKKDTQEPGQPGGKDQSAEKGKGKPDEQGAAPNQGGTNGPGAQGGGQLGGRDDGSKSASDGARPLPEEAGEEGTPAEARFGKQATDLQLEEIKKRVQKDKDILKKANMTEAEYQRFLKAYEDLLKQQAAASPDKENLAAPQRGNAGLPNQGVRRVQPGAQTKQTPLERGGPALAPPEFRESYKEFTRRLADMERKREKN